MSQAPERTKKDFSKQFLLTAALLYLKLIWCLQRDCLANFKSLNAYLCSDKRKPTTRVNLSENLDYALINNNIKYAGFVVTG